MVTYILFFIFFINKDVHIQIVHFFVFIKKMNIIMYRDTIINSFFFISYAHCSLNALSLMSKLIGYSHIKTAGIAHLATMKLHNGHGIPYLQKVYGTDAIDYLETRSWFSVSFRKKWIMVLLTGARPRDDWWISGNLVDEVNAYFE